MHAGRRSTWKASGRFAYHDHRWSERRRKDPEVFAVWAAFHRCPCGRVAMSPNDVPLVVSRCWLFRPPAKAKKRVIGIARPVHSQMLDATIDVRHEQTKVGW
jgi:hypothetical protein